eukprot:TRINITY_DN11273_c1_g1_i1.p1 TRINITY_DN11273_c1_g1~~TRINITY_DN11273_c1_g1_i1.p1  ORF type:complete len:418 (+),score=74.88 TRINITY_DN11273_c1_g1_i1:25-1254(+)
MGHSRQPMKLFEFLVLCLVGSITTSKVSRSRSELSNGALLAQHEKLVLPEKATLQHMEDSLIKMAVQKKADAAGTDLSQFLQQILNIIEGTMKGNIINRVNQTQERLDNASESLANCSNEFYPNASLLIYLNASHTEHLHCRQTQSQKEAAKRIACDDAVAGQTQAILCREAELKKVIPIPADVCTMAEGTLVPTIGNYLIQMENYWKTRYEQAVEADERCANATDPGNDDCRNKTCEAEDQRIRCQKKQQLFEEKACELNSQYSCSSYSSCYSTRQTTLLDEIDDAQNDLSGLKAEWRSIMRIECLVQALNATEGDIGTQIDICKSKRHTAALTLSIPDVPNQTACTPWVDLKPGTALFGVNWYSTLPEDASALQCASSSCCSHPSSPLILPGYSDGVNCSSNNTVTI